MGATQSTNRVRSLMRWPVKDFRQAIHVRDDVKSELRIGLRFSECIPRLADEIVHDPAFECEPLAKFDSPGSRQLALMSNRDLGEAPLSPPQTSRASLDRKLNRAASLAQA